MGDEEEAAFGVAEEEGGGFAVEAQIDCPHCSTVKVFDSESLPKLAEAACSACAVERAAGGGAEAEGPAAKENWVCLNCCNTGCSRYVKGHGLKHAQEAEPLAAAAAAGGAGAGSGGGGDIKHPIAISLSDLSIWCYSCEVYLDAFNNGALQPYFAFYHKEAHGSKPELPVACVRKTHHGGDPSC